jgi:uncharacterized membrane protein
MERAVEDGPTMNRMSPASFSRRSDPAVHRGGGAWSWPVLLLWALVLAACGEDREPPEAERAADEATVAQTPISGFPEGVTGELEFRDGDLTFRACEEESGIPVTDGTGEDLEAMVEELGHGEGRVTAHIVLEGGVVQELRVASPEVPSCLELLPEAELRARGNEPFWLVDVDGEVATFRSPDELEGVRYDEGSWQATTGGWRFEALRHGVDGVAYLILDVEESRCRDTMSGAWFPYAASLRVGGEPATGCASEGRR